MKNNRILQATKCVLRFGSGQSGCVINLNTSQELSVLCIREYNSVGCVMVIMTLCDHCGILCMHIIDIYDLHIYLGYTMPCEHCVGVLS